MFDTFSPMLRHPKQLAGTLIACGLGAMPVDARARMPSSSSSGTRKVGAQIASSQALLAIYLNDHLAGAVAGAELAARLAGSDRAEETLERLATEIAEDRDELRALMRRLDIGVDRLKTLGAWTAEKAGRLKLNGRLLGYSPLSRVEELEMLRLAITGKRTLWRTLLTLAPSESRLRVDELQRLSERAEHQLYDVERRHAEALRVAFWPTP